VDGTADVEDQGRPALILIVVFVDRTGYLCVDRQPGRHMPKLIEQPTIIQAAGNKPKQIEEFAGRVNSGHAAVSVARMVSPQGWREPGQRPEFEEITVVLRGMLRVEHDGGLFDIRAGQAVVTHPGEWVCYSSPEPGGAEYIAVCVPAFSPETVHRDA
jgi:mannose-6-phosphate isomerase-like protein (cupin superfamily)